MLLYIMLFSEKNKSYYVFFKRMYLAGTDSQHNTTEYFYTIQYLF